MGISFKVGDLVQWFSVYGDNITSSSGLGIVTNTKDPYISDNTSILLYEVYLIKEQKKRTFTILDLQQPGPDDHI